MRLRRIEINTAESAAAATKAIEPQVRDLARRVLNRSRTLTPVRTGQLRARQRVILRITATTVQAQIEARTSYAMYVHEGTRPHEIRPRRVSYLRFVAGDAIVFAKVVHHPGTRGVFFMKRALQEEAGPAGFRVSATAPMLQVLDLTG